MAKIESQFWKGEIVGGAWASDSESCARYTIRHVQQSSVRRCRRVKVKEHRISSVVSQHTKYHK